MVWRRSGNSGDCSAVVPRRYYSGDGYAFAVGAVVRGQSNDGDDGLPAVRWWFGGHLWRSVGVTLLEIIFAEGQLPLHSREDGLFYW